MAKILYLMRHGETLFNELKLKQGWSDSPLTENGIEQAKLAGRYFQEASITFQSAYSSTQERATDTLKLVTDAPYQQVKGIKERHFGYREATPERFDPKREPGQVVLDQYFVDQGGESVAQVLERYSKALKEIMETDSNEEVLVVAHGVANYIFFINQENPQSLKPSYANCAITKYLYRNGHFVVDQVIDPAKP